MRFCSEKVAEKEISFGDKVALFFLICFALNQPTVKLAAVWGGAQLCVLLQIQMRGFSEDFLTFRALKSEEDFCRVQGNKEKKERRNLGTEEKERKCKIRLWIVMTTMAVNVKWNEVNDGWLFTWKRCWSDSSCCLVTLSCLLVMSVGCFALKG